MSQKFGSVKLIRRVVAEIQKLLIFQDFLKFTLIIMAAYFEAHSDQFRGDLRRVRKAADFIGVLHYNRKKLIWLCNLYRWKNMLEFLIFYSVHRSWFRSENSEMRNFIVQFFEWWESGVWKFEVVCEWNTSGKINERQKILKCKLSPIGPKKPANTDKLKIAHCPKVQIRG